LRHAVLETETAFLLALLAYALLESTGACGQIVGSTSLANLIILSLTEVFDENVDASFPIRLATAREQAGDPTTIAARVPRRPVCAGAGYQQVNMFSNIPGLAQNTDPNLTNAWGIAVGPVTARVSANGNDVSTVYKDGTNGNPCVNSGLVVSIPGGAPTGQVFNPTTDFVISDGAGHSAAAIFTFASEGGSITG
jgi:hypothetical protein